MDIKKYINNKKGISQVGMIVIACIIIVALLGMANFALNWGNKKVVDTTQTVDQQYEEWKSQ